MATRPTPAPAAVPFTAAMTGASMRTKREIAEQLAEGASAALGATKRLIAHSLGALESQMVLESETIARHAVGEEGREGVSAFLEKRRPRFPDTDSA